MTRMYNRDAETDSRIDAFEEAVAEWDAMSDDEKEEQREADYQDWLEMMKSEAP